jgi:pimeloyl-ACP methyl ester carboxylesterase
MAGAVRRPLVTRRPLLRRPSGVPWAAALVALLGAPALFLAAPAHADAPATLGCANVTQPAIVTGTTPVLFVHGIDSDPTTWTQGSVGLTLEPPLDYVDSALGTPQQVTGYTFNWSNYSGFKYGSKLAWVTGPPAPGPGPLLAQAIECVAGKSGRKVIIIAHSMGGLLTEYASTTGSVADDIAAVFTLGTPFQGSWLDSTAIGPLGWLTQAIGAYCAFGGSLSSAGPVGQGAKQHAKAANVCRITSQRSDPGMQAMLTSAPKKQGWHALRWADGFPVFRLAASIQATWQSLPFGTPITLHDFGDFVVGTGSELDGATRPTVTCTVPVPNDNTLVLPTLLAAVVASSCFHPSEPDNKVLLDSVISTVAQHHLIPTAAIKNLTAGPPPSGYFRYTNPRFKFSFDVPDGYTAGAPPADGDGRSFTNGTGTVTAFGQDYSPGEMTPADDLAELVSSYGSSGDQVTLRYRNGGIVAVSGKTPQGAIFYQRDVVFPSVIYSLVWNYPAADNAQYAPLVNHTVSSFTPGPDQGN